MYVETIKIPLLPIPAKSAYVECIDNFELIRPNTLKSYEHARNVFGYLPISVYTDVCQCRFYNNITAGNCLQ